MPAPPRRSSRRSTPRVDPDEPDPTPDDDIFLAALRRPPPPDDDPAPRPTVGGPGDRRLPAARVDEARDAGVALAGCGLGFALALGLFAAARGAESEAGILIFGLLAVLAGFILLGAMVNLALRAPGLLRAWGRRRWLRRLDRALAGTGLTAEAGIDPPGATLVGADRVVAGLTRGRWPGRVGYTAASAALEGLTVTLEASGAIVVDGDPRRTHHLSPSAHAALRALLEGGACVDDGRISGACALGALAETAERLTRLARPGEGDALPTADRPLVPTRALARDLPLNAVSSAARVAGVGAAFAMVARCNTLERTTIWSQEIRVDAYGTALVALAVAGVAVFASRGAWSALVEGVDRMWWFSRTARGLHRQGLRLTRAGGRDWIYDPRDRRRRVEVARLGGEWHYVAPIPGLERSTITLDDGPGAIAGLRIDGDRVAAVSAMTPEVRALALPLLAAGASIRNGHIYSVGPYAPLLEHVLSHAEVFGAAAPPGDRWQRAVQRMNDDPDPVWRLACVEAALDTEADPTWRLARDEAALAAGPDRLGLTRGVARASEHPELRLVASALPGAMRRASGPADASAEGLLTALGDAGPAVVEAIARITTRHGPGDEGLLVALGDACPAARRAVVTALTGRAATAEAALCRWLPDADDPTAVTIADALARWGTAAALRALEDTARSASGGPRAERLGRAARLIRARAFTGHDGGLALAETPGGELALAGSPGGELALSGPRPDPGA